MRFPSLLGWLRAGMVQLGSSNLFKGPHVREDDTPCAVQTPTMNMQPTSPAILIYYTISLFARKIMHARAQCNVITVADVCADAQ